MTLNELYVLNSAIDGQDIYSIPAFSDNRLSQMSVDLIKESMIEKGYLEDNNTLSLQGASEVRRIEQFKKAIKHITILDLIIGCIDGEKGILLEVFPDLFTDDGLKGIKGFNSKYVNPRQLLIDYPVKAETSFILNIYNSNNISENTNEFYFLSDGKKYCYDCDKHMLYEKSSKELKDIICVRIKGGS